jgi:hypothetical protein
MQKSGKVRKTRGEGCPGTPQSQSTLVVSTFNAIIFEIPRLIFTVSWLSISLAFNAVAGLIGLFTTALAWMILACHLCVFSLHATWIALRNVAVARRGQLTIREVLDSISGNRALEASS